MHPEPLRGRGDSRAIARAATQQGQVNPNAINLLKSLNHPVEGLRSKDWLEFAESDAPKYGFCVYGLRSGCRRSVSDLAGTADECPLGIAGPGGS